MSSGVVHISRHDETHIKVSSELAIEKELFDHFSFLVPNYQHRPSVRNRFWDGRIRLYSPKTKFLYYGLHSHVEEFCKKNDYKCIYDDPLDVEHPFSIDEFKRMAEVLKLSTMDDGVRVDIVPHDFQERGIIHAIQAGRCLLLSPTASGKSLCIYILLRYYLAKTNSNALILVPTKNLVQQLYGDFVDYAFYTNWDAEGLCHLIFDGSERETDKRVTISTWQALAVKERLPKEIQDELRAQKTPAQFKAFMKRWNKQADYILPEKYFEQFGIVFGDECHSFASDENCGGGELLEIMSKAKNAQYRIGTTGTLRDSKVHHLILEGVFGKVYQTITTREMIDQKKAADIVIKCLLFQYSEAQRKEVRKKTYQEEIEFLITHTARNRFLCNLALSLPGNTMLLFDRVDKHGRILHEMIVERMASGRKVFFVSGDTPTKDRNQVRNIVEMEKNAIIVASYGTFSTGVNIRNLHNLIFGSPAKAKIRVMQSIGRGLRKSKSKSMVTLYDAADDLSCWNKAGTSSHDNYSLQHFTERINYYNMEQLDYKTYRISLLEDNTGDRLV